MARIALIQNIMVESMAYMSISAVLKQARHQVEVFYINDVAEHGAIRQLVRFMPDLVGFSILSPSLDGMLALAESIKRAFPTLTIFGNIGTILNPEIIEHPGVDVVCLGEGEYAMKELADCLDTGMPYHQIAGLWVKTRGGIQKNKMPVDLLDLDKLPFLDRQLYDKYAFFRHSPYLRVAVGRGCPGSCSFCNNPFLRKYYGGKRYIRKQSPARAIRELEYQVAQRKHVRFIFFTDEVFWVDREWLRLFLDLYRDRIRIPFNADFNFFSALEEEDIELFKDSCLNNFIFAVETGDEKQRAGLLNKKVSDERIFQLAGWFHKYKIKYVSSVMFGLPGDTVKDHVDRIGFFERLNPTYLWTAFFQPYPGLRLTESPSVQEKLARDQDFSSTVHHAMCLESPEHQQLTNLKKVYFLCVKFPWLRRPLLGLARRRIPFLFDIIFMMHFTYYIFAFERVSLAQFGIHLRIFGFNPMLRKFRKFIARV